MRRLYLQIYLAFLGVVVLCVLSAGAVSWALTEERDELSPFMRGAAGLLVEGLPDEPGARAAALRDRAARLSLDLSLWGADGALVAASGQTPVDPRGHGEGWTHGHGGPGLAVKLDDGRWLVGTAAPGVARARHGRFFALLAVLLGVMAAGVYPVARRITRRIEALERGVARWGAGDLSARVPVCGKDEVAALAARFNAAADRVEGLVEAQRRVLASASHELRSPLARLRMAVELLDDADPDRAALVADARVDVAELDLLIGDLLLSARLESGSAAREPVELGGLVAEEGARVGATVTAAEVVVDGDPRALRRMVRNLLENARRHGGGGAVEATVEALPNGARVVIADRGPGIPEALRERIFEPFYRPAGHREGDDGGVGLGLALVRQVAKAHAGLAYCEGREGGGARFVVEIGG